MAKRQPNDTGSRMWNTPADVARHREMTPEQRLRKAIELSRAATRFANAGRRDGR